MVYLNDHRPALLGLGATLGLTGYHAIFGETGDTHATLELIKLWMAIIGQGVAILAGLASFAWYAYSIYKKKTDDRSSDD